MLVTQTDDTSALIILKLSDIYAKGNMADAVYQGCQKSGGSVFPVIVKQIGRDFKALKLIAGSILQVAHYEREIAATKAAGIFAGSANCPLS